MMQLLERHSMERMLAVLVASGLVFGVYASVRSDPPQRTAEACASAGCRDRLPASSRI